MRLDLRWLLLLLLACAVQAKNHTLYISNDARRTIEFTSFGFLDSGVFELSIANLSLSLARLQLTPQTLERDALGFTFSSGLDRRDYANQQSLHSCPLVNRHKRQDTHTSVYLLFDFAQGKLLIERPDALKQLVICADAANCPPAGATSTTAAVRSKRSVVDNVVDEFTKSAADGKSWADEKAGTSQADVKPTAVGAQQGTADGPADLDEDEDSRPVATFRDHPVARQRNPGGSTTEHDRADGAQSTAAAADAGRQEPAEPDSESAEATTAAWDRNAPLVNELPLSYNNATDTWAVKVGRRLVIKFTRASEEGSYVLMLHNCHNYNAMFNKLLTVSAVTSMVEKNGASFLPADDLVKPMLYFMLALLFLLTALVWVSVVHSGSGQEVYRVHYLMTALVFIKCLSLFFHGINFYFIGAYGHQREVWAVVYYVMHLLKGALLFGVIILIGTGYTFFKNFLTDRDRRLFMMVLPLQVLDNIAMIILLEREEGSVNYKFWMQLFVFIDLACCVAIIIPVVWSIRHLQEASRTDGKAAFNVEKLKLFRHFYILVITYIYVTRVIGMLVAITAPFKYGYLEVLVLELGTWTFFVVSGYKFRPQRNNPYLKLSQTDDIEMGESVTQSGVLEGITRLNRGGPTPGAKRTSMLSTALGLDTSDSSHDDDDDDVLFLAGNTPKTQRPDGSGPEMY